LTLPERHFPRSLYEEDGFRMPSFLGWSISKQHSYFYGQNSFQEIDSSVFLFYHFLTLMSAYYLPAFPLGNLSQGHVR
jgi:hypothetical protein